MLSRTHLVIALFGILLLLNHVENQLVFVFVVLFVTLLPDIDSSTSRLGRKGISKVITAFTKHRGIFHSLIFVLVIYLVLLFYWPVVSFGFLFGYCLHLFTDCFTKRGVRLFYPLKFRIRGFIKSGGKIELFIFLLFAVLDLGLLVFNLYSRLL